MPFSRSAAAFALAAAVLVLDGRAQTIVDKLPVRQNRGIFNTTFTYRYRIVSPATTNGPVTRICIQFKLGVDQVLDRGSHVEPAGWEYVDPPLPPNAGHDVVCWKCDSPGSPAPGGVPPGGTLGIFEISTVDNPTALEQAQIARAFTSLVCAGPFTPLGPGPETVVGNFQSDSTVPPGFDFAHLGSSGNPWAAQQSQTIQGVYTAAGMPRQPITITDVAVRPDPASLPAAGGSISSLQITMATSANPFNALSTTFANNLGANAAVVFNGPFGVGPQPAPAGVVTGWQWIHLATPFTYDARNGDLLIQWRKSGLSHLGMFMDHHFDGTKARGVRNLFSSTATTGSASFFVPNVLIRFDHTANFQINPPDAGLTIDRAGTNGLFPAVGVNPLTGTLELDWNDPSGTSVGFDIGVVAGPAIPGNTAPGLITPGGQALNVNVLDPTFQLAFGGTFPPFAPFAGSIPVPGAGDITAQLASFTPANPEGFALSAAATSRGIAPGSGSAPGPTADDDGVFVNLAAIGAPPITFHGTPFDFIKVLSNGRVQFIFGSPSGDPTTAAAMAGYPMVGAWADFDPSAGGSIGVSASPTGVVTVSWTAVPYKLNPTLQSTFSIAFDTRTDEIEISGLSSFPVFPSSPGVSNQMFLGISRGSLGGATDPGPVTYTTATLPAPPTNGMTYSLGQAGTLAPGINRVLFSPDPSEPGDYLARGFFP